jgi:hypothetical protein
MNLIGEEIYAVGAYINRTQELLSSIATSDIFKVAAMVLMVLGSILATIGAAGPLISFFTW